MRATFSLVVFLGCLIYHAAPVGATAHPRLLMSSNDIAEIVALAEYPSLFKSSLVAAQARTDAHFETFPDVPKPVDPGGGYSHEQHKRNGIAIREAAMVYQLTKELRYANYAKEMLLAYAEMYPGLGEHPMKKEQTPGRLFWQSLNESVWLVYAIQGFDAIFPVLNADERQTITSNLIRPMADFLSIESPQTFDRLHNHGTWAVAAVGMTGYVLGDQTYVNRALFGLNEDGEAGFLKQLKVLLSPDGFYAEGPYYQRYALMPIVVFATSIQANEPHREIFEFRDGIVLKAILACAELSYGRLLFPINDAIRDKGLDSVELRYGFALAYAETADPALLSLIRDQGTVELTSAGFQAARAIDQDLAIPYEHRSTLFMDGASGDQGGLGVLRNGTGPNHQAVVLKGTAQGMGHGHFDKLHWLFYDRGQPVIDDYGAARFLNIAAKNGGRYLPENQSWAKQSVAHNTLVVDEVSHFNATLAVAEQSHPTIEFFLSDESVHVVSGKMDDAYPDVAFSRTLVVLDGLITESQLVVDLIKIAAEQDHQYDLPLHFRGEFIESTPALSAQTDRLQPLGKGNGYEHLWLRANTTVSEDTRFSMTWLLGDRFYTYTTQNASPIEVLYTELGANDPDLNLRRQQALIARLQEASTAVFLSTIEAHGEYNGTEEYTVNAEGSVEALEHIEHADADVLRIETSNGRQHFLTLSNRGESGSAHEISIEEAEQTLVWQGYIGLFDESNRIWQSD